MLRASTCVAVSLSALVGDGLRPEHWQRPGDRGSWALDLLSLLTFHLDTFTLYGRWGQRPIAGERGPATGPSLGEGGRPSLYEAAVTSHLHRIKRLEACQMGSISDYLAVGVRSMPGRCHL